MAVDTGLLVQYSVQQHSHLYAWRIDDKDSFEALKVLTTGLARNVESVGVGAVRHPNLVHISLFLCPTRADPTSPSRSIPTNAFSEPINYKILFLADERMDETAKYKRTTLIISFVAMASLTTRSASLLLLISSALAFTPCPLLGPAFPPFTLNSTNSELVSSMKELTKSFDSLVKTDTGPNGDVSPNTTFSIALFSSNPGSSEGEPFFWQYHYTSPALKSTSGTTSDVNADSIYRIGGLTEVFTVWSLLLAEGDHVFSDVITKYLPELNTASLLQGAKADPVHHTRWDEITVGQLMSHMSGLARDCKSSIGSNRL